MGGYPVSIKKMSEDTAQAMWQDSNVNIRSCRVILRYLRGTFGRNIFIPATKQNGGECLNTGNYKPVDPDSNFCDIEDESIYFLD